MPTYAYKCDSCKSEHEVSQKITDEPLKNCPACNQPSLKRGPGGGIGLSFKGSGFYITDYAQKSSNQECCPCGKKESCN